MKQNRETSNVRPKSAHNNPNEKSLKCPKWSKQESFKSFKSNLEIWNSCSKSEGKYLQLIESFHSSERMLEKQKVELEIQNVTLNPFDKDIIGKLVIKMNDWFGKPQMSASMDSYVNFMSNRRKDRNDLYRYMLGFDTFLLELKCPMCNLPEQVNALQLLISLNL